MKTKLKIMGLLAAALIISPTGLALARHHERHPATVALTPAGQKLEGAIRHNAQKAAQPDRAGIAFYGPGHDASVYEGLSRSDRKKALS